jgi:integrase
MASIGKEAGGTKRILFYAPDGKRKTIRLGKATQRQAEAVCLRVEKLITAKLTGHSPDDDTARWLNEVDDRLRQKLARAGLVESQESAQETVGAFIDSYIAMRTDVKPRTKSLYEQTRRSILQFFDTARPISSLTAGDADAWLLFLKEQGLAQNTIRRRCGRAKQFFKAAVRQKLIHDNPFGDLKSLVVGNPERFYFVSREEAQQVIDACPDAEWRLIFALSRFGGLRCPSEHLALRWGDVN